MMASLMYMQIWPTEFQAILLVVYFLSKLRCFWKCIIFCLRVPSYTFLLIQLIFVSQLQSADAAVMVFIHGGGFSSGYSYDWNGIALAAIGDVIVVTINYRVAAFGFFVTGIRLHYMKSTSTLWKIYKGTAAKTKIEHVLGAISK